MSKHGFVCSWTFRHRYFGPLYVSFTIKNSRPIDHFSTKNCAKSEDDIGFIQNAGVIELLGHETFRRRLQKTFPWFWLLNNVEFRTMTTWCRRQYRQKPFMNTSSTPTLSTVFIDTTYWRQFNENLSLLNREFYLTLSLLSL